MVMEELRNRLVNEVLTGQWEAAPDDVHFNAYRDFCIFKGYLTAEGELTDAGREFIKWYEKTHGKTYIVAKIILAVCVLGVIVALGMNLL